jgi:signal transduction histidine kinase
LLGGSGTSGEPASENLGAIREALHHALTLSERLSDDPARPHATVSEAAGSLQRCARLVEPLIGKSGALETALPESLGAIDLEEAEFSELTINLLVNAREAIGQGGTVRLSARKLASPERVAFEVADDGCGMEEQLVRRIFRAGVSAKRGGTGLGLARVRQILAKCAGIIEVQSTVGSGTVFHVEIPNADLSHASVVS